MFQISNCKVEHV